MTVPEALAILQAHPAQWPGIADWLQEQGKEELAYAVRWASSRDRRPHPSSFSSDEPYGWYFRSVNGNWPTPECDPGLARAVLSRDLTQSNVFGSLEHVWSWLAHRLVQLRILISLDPPDSATSFPPAGR